MSMKHIIAATIAVVLAGASAAQAAGSTMHGSNADSARLLRAMDTDRSGTVSQAEFSQFIGRSFKRLDTNHDGKLERNELRRMASPNWPLTAGTRHPSKR